MCTAVRKTSMENYSNMNNDGSLTSFSQMLTNCYNIWHMHIAQADLH